MKHRDFLEFDYSGRPVVFASGYFDPLHAGHVRYLQAARRLGDYLFVIVNNDRQCTAKKGYAFMPHCQRVEVVSALACVDACMASLDVGPSVAATLEGLVEFVRWLEPDATFLFANGGDVKDALDCREADVCRRLGVEMVFGVGGEEKAASSSEMVRRAAGCISPVQTN